MEMTAIGWAASPIIRFMIDKTLGYLKKPLKRTYGMEADLEKLKQILPEIQAVVSVAETLKVVNPHQVDLLRKMKEAVYDAEDVVDEFNYRLLEAEAAKEEDSVAEKLGAMLLTAGKRLVGADPLQTSLSKAIKGLEGVDKTAKAFIRACNLEKTADQGQSSGPQQAHTANNRVTTSMKHENKFVGRDADINNIVDKIKEQADCSSARPLVISVVGVGGIGKTTLAQWVYNHQEIASNVSDVKMWVSVANTFDHDTVTRQVLAEAKSENINNGASLNTVQKEIIELLGSKKFLLILDDVWVDEKKDENKVNNRETWKKFFSVFNQCKGGSTIIVTTRLASAVNMIGDCIKFDLKGLSKEDSEELFMSHAFPERVGKSTELEAIGKDIAEKLKGLPLALKVVGMQLKGNHSIKDWKNILRNTVSAAGNVMDILKLSYDHLPSHLKPCFGYCSLFPKGYHFTENEINQLIHMWIAQGFIYNKDRSDGSLEDIGRSYFNNLCSRSFFQLAEYWYMPTSCYVMHDLINDLAQFVSREECWQIQSQSHQSNSPSTLLRHVSVSSTDLHVLSKKIRLDKLRTLLILNRSEGHVCTQMEGAILASLKGARVLDLSGCCIEKLPETIEQMIHLRYLAFDSTSTLLPEACSRLFNLQVVCMAVHRSKPRGGVICKKGLDGCAPKNMSSLNNLSHVYVLDRYLVEITGHWKIPQFHGNAVFTLNLDNKLEDIHDIGFQGNLAIKKLENARSKHDDLKPIICQNELMKELKLEWCSSAPIPRNNYNDNVVLEFLLPPSNLSNLQVCGYRGSKYPFWLKKNYLTSLSSLCLTNCRELRELPPLGQLPKLQDLELSELNAVEEISQEFYGTKDAFGFPCLHWLKLGYMQNLVEWSIPEFNYLTNLSSLCLKNCRELRKLPPLGQLPKLQDLELSELNVVEEISPEFYGTKDAFGFPCLEWLRLGYMQNLVQWSIPEFNYLTSLSSLCLTNCRELRELPPLGQLPRLQELELSKLNAVEEISPEFYGTKDAFGFPCLKLLNLGCMQNLIEWSIPEFNFRPLFPLLEDVIITECYKLRRVPNIFPVTKGYKRLCIDDKVFDFAFVSCSLTSSSAGQGQDTIEEIREMMSKKLGRFSNLTFFIVSCAPTSSSGGQDTFDKIREMISKRTRPLVKSESELLLLWKVADISGFKFVSGDIKSLFEVQTCMLEMLDFHSHPEVVKDLYMFNWRSLMSKVGFTKLSSLESLSIEYSKHLLWFRVLHEEEVALLPTSLKSLAVKNYRATSNFFSRCFQSLSSLLQLELEDVDIIEGIIIDLHWLTSLTELRIKYCKNLKGINGLEALTCLTTMEIKGSPRLSWKIDQYDFLKPFSSLSTFKIRGLYFHSSKYNILDLQHCRELKVLHIRYCKGKFKLINCSALTSLAELVIYKCQGLIMDPVEFSFLKSLHNLELKLNDWAPPLLHEGANEVQETKREDKAESKSSDCSINEFSNGTGYPLGSHLMLHGSSLQPECMKPSCQPSRLETSAHCGASVSLMREELFKCVEFDRLGPDGLSLRDWIIARETCASMPEFHPPHDLFGGDHKIISTYNDIKDLMKMNWLNVSIIQLYMMKLYNICQKKNIQNIGFMDPARINATYWGKEKQATITYMAETMQSQRTILAPYFEDHHWVLLVIKPSEGTVHVLDSLYRRDKNHTIKDAFAQAMQGAATFSWIADYPSPQQIGGFECGYYVMNLMQDIITTNPEFPKGGLPQKYTDSEIDSVRRSWVHFFLEEAEQKMEIEENKAIQNEEFRSEEEQAACEILQNLNIHSNVCTIDTHFN